MKKPKNVKIFFILLISKQKTANDLKRKTQKEKAILSLSNFLKEANMNNF